MVVSSHVDASVNVEVTVFVCRCASFSRGAGDLNSALHAHVAGTLPTTPSRHLCYFYF